jgi:hypothetical protein
MAMFCDLRGREWFASERSLGWIEPLLAASGSIGALIDEGRPQKIVQDGDQLRFPPGHTGGEKLAAQPRTIDVNHQAGEKIPLGVDQPIGIRMGRQQAATILEGCLDSLAEEVCVYRSVRLG